MIDIAIIGGGPAGLSAALYATRGGGGRVVLFEHKVLGGQITSSSEIENYPGVAGVVSGLDFMEPWKEQAFRFGLQHEFAEVLRVSSVDSGGFKLLLQDGRELEARSVIVATGGRPRQAGIQGEQEFFGRGVSTCATCDGFFYRNRVVAVIGGGNTALEEALYLAHICSEVHLIHRRDSFKAAPVTIEKVMKESKIKLWKSCIPEEIFGDKTGVLGMRLSHIESGAKEEIPVMGVFVFVGFDMNNGVLKQADGKFLCEVEPNTGSVVVDFSMRTQVPGLFVAGDLRIHAPKQVVCAAGDGATAALSALSYLENLKS